jgi:hypothetical protein
LWPQPRNRVGGGPVGGVSAGGGGVHQSGGRR